eukprot:TRINITY_DN100996_c0_g1_i1.p1 TRINITY_DN100996_c0_g1~~TRINITY_DN100996_c0_g1_i1.p1  ORF type:complete len:561 (-),score=114.44 TRINITY_DN100996_c0_g1_i1:488-2170(-)
MAAKQVSPSLQPVRPARMLGTSASSLTAAVLAAPPTVGSHRHLRRLPSQAGLLAAATASLTLVMSTSARAVSSRCRPSSVRAVSLAAGSSASPGSVAGETKQLRQRLQGLAAHVAKLRSEAQRQYLAGRAPAPPLPPNMGLETAPPEIQAKFSAMTCGSTAYPTDAAVEALWETLCRKVHDLEEAAAASQQAFALEAAWDPPSPWALRFAGASSLEDSADAADELGPPDLEWATEALERWFTYATRSAGGMLGGGAPAADAGFQQSPARRGSHQVEVYATHLTNDDYVLGASALAASLSATGTTRPLVALVTSGVSPGGRRSLYRAGWSLVDVELAGVEGADAAHNRGYFTKIWLWALPADAVVYIDTDILVLDNLDHLFEEHPEAELVAAPDSQPHMDGEMSVQSGVMVVRPSPERFADLWDVCCGSRRPSTGSLDSAYKQHEQGFLTEYFDGGGPAEGALGGVRRQWQPLDGKYNFCLRYHTRPLYDGLTPENVPLIHFACAKPWDLAQRDYAPPAYVELYLEFLKHTGIPWRPGSVFADRLREKEQKERMAQIMAER